MCNGLLTSACRIGSFSLVISLNSLILCATAVAQPETPSWTTRGAQAPGSVQLRSQQQFGVTTTSEASALDESDSVYRPQVLSTSETRTMRVRPAVTSKANSLPVRSSSGILQSSHERLAPVPAQQPVAATAASHPNPQAPPATFYDKDRAEPMASDSESAASSDSDLIQMVEALQWTVAVLALGVLVVLIIKNYKTPGAASSSTREIRHVATIPVRNVFQAHLLEIRGQQFLVTTDRNGVKTVTPVTQWEDFESSLETTPAHTAIQATGTLTS